MEELLKAFRLLTDEDKLAFFKEVMPELCDLFRQDPQKAMGQMMPLCREMMQNCNFDPQKIMQMMNGMSEKNK